MPRLFARYSNYSTIAPDINRDVLLVLDYLFVCICTFLGSLSRASGGSV